MRARTKIWAIVLAAFFLWMSSLPGQTNNAVSLELLLTLGENNSELFQWASVCTDEDENIYVTDMMDNSIKKFNPAGELATSKTLPNADGPDTKAIRIIGCRGRSLYVTDQNKSGLFRFDANLNYRGSVPYKKLIADFLVANPNLFYVAPAAISGMMKMDAIDSTGKVLRSYSMASEGKGGLWDMFSFTQDFLGDWYICYRFKDRVARLTPTADVVWQLGLYPGKKSEKERILFLEIPKTIFYLDAAFDSHDHLFLLLGHLAKNPNRDILILDRSGHKVGQLTLDDTTHLLYIDSKDNLYVRAQKGTVLKKYKINYTSR
ncbi:MAG TPA: hypothetical protein PKY55_00085 [bacterium]|nr:hypothetical protein [bacterium]HOY45677.1 hypothetical protein [bacterium]HPG81651.1 hypothetical protein [bacterium]HPM57962.1 hypothetical protein [bacterium]